MVEERGGRNRGGTREEMWEGREICTYIHLESLTFKVDFVFEC